MLQDSIWITRLGIQSTLTRNLKLLQTLIVYFVYTLLANSFNYDKKRN